MASWFKALRKIREKVAIPSRLEGKNPSEILEELEGALLSADVSPRLVMEIIDDLDRMSRAHPAKKMEALKKKLIACLPPPTALPESPFPDTPLVVMLVGVNGSGKTTTSAKLAHRVQQNGRKALLAAGDTFRAAGTSQLALWAERLNVNVVSAQTGSDPASVAFDAVEAGKARGMDYVFLDTAGRMHTKKPLMEELDKIRRSMSKALPGAPHQTWIVLDASLGQNAILQATFFHEVVPITGVIVTKLDGSSRAGFLFSVFEKLNVPVYFAGLGEGADDLEPFDPTAFVDALLPEEG